MQRWTSFLDQIGSLSANANASYSKPKWTSVKVVALGYVRPLSRVLASSLTFSRTTEDTRPCCMCRAMAPGERFMMRSVRFLANQAFF
jgi:hypothetical protein